jgi:pimeloyl-ACP methyl ester carboxylesterase
MLHFQEPGVAEAELEADVRASLKKVYFALSGDAPPGAWVPDAPRGVPFLPLLPDPPDGPLSFLSDEELDEAASVFARVGFTGPLNRYRAAVLDGPDSADIVGVTVDQPSCFIGGERDAVRAMIPGSDLYADPGAGCTDLRSSTIVPGVGHWVHQEAPAEVNAALTSFLDGL